MRDIITATIDENHFLKCSTYSIARNGEGLTPCLSVSFPDSLSEYWAYIDFKKPNGETFKTPRIDYIDGKIIYNIPCAVLDVEGELEIQVVFQNEDGEIWKSYVKEFAVRYSINATDDIPEKEDFIAEAQKLLNTLEDAAELTQQASQSAKDSATAAQQAVEQVRAAIPEWELIHEVTLEEAVATTSIKVEGYGDTSKGVRVKVTIPSKNDMGDTSITLPNNRLRIKASLNGSNRVLEYYASNWALLNAAPTHCVYDIIPVEAVWNVETAPYIKEFYNISGNITVQANDKVRYVNFDANTANPIPVGTKIECWRLK